MLSRNKVSFSGIKGDNLYLEIPFGTDSYPVRKKVDLQRVLCCTLYLKSVLTIKKLQESHWRTILRYNKLTIRANF